MIGTINGGRSRVLDEKKYILVKIPRKSNNRLIDDAIQNQYLRKYTREYFNSMQYVWREFKNANDVCCFAVRPMAYFEKWNAIVMIEENGCLLRDLLRFGAPPANERFLMYLMNASRWLRIYHENIGNLSFEELSLESVSEQLDVLLLQLAGYSFGEVDTNALKKMLMPLVEDGIIIQTAILHDDFHYSNLLVSNDGRICGLDAKRRERRAPIYVDLATLIVDPETRVASIVTGGLLISQNFLKKSRQSILEAYFGEDTWDDSMLNYYCALSIIDKWMINERRLSIGRLAYFGVLLRPWIRRYFLRLLAKYVN